MTRRPARALSLGALISVLLLSLGAARAQTPTPTPEPPPPTPVIQPGGQTSLSPFPSTLRTPSATTEAPEISAATAVLADLDTGQVLFALNRNERRPIASVTKIMTALLVVERTNLTDVVTVSEGAASGQVSGISGLGLAEGERIRVDELLYALLLQSANDAAVALAEHVSGSVDAFVDEMNARAEELGLGHTSYAAWVAATPEKRIAERSSVPLGRLELPRRTWRAVRGEIAAGAPPSLALSGAASLSLSFTTP